MVAIKYVVPQGTHLLCINDLQTKYPQQDRKSFKTWLVRRNYNKLTYMVFTSRRKPCQTYCKISLPQKEEIIFISLHLTRRLNCHCNYHKMYWFMNCNFLPIIKYKSFLNKSILNHRTILSSKSCNSEGYLSRC